MNLNSYIKSIFSTSSLYELKVVFEKIAANDFDEVNKSYLHFIEKSSLKYSESEEYFRDRASLLLIQPLLKELETEWFITISKEFFLNKQEVVILPLKEGENLYGALFLDLERTENNQVIEDLTTLCTAFSHQRQLIIEREANQNKDIWTEKGVEAFWELDLDTYDLNLSENYLRILGYKPENFPCNLKGLLKYIHVDDRELVTSTFDPGNNQNDSLIECEFRILDSQGKYRWLLTQSIFEKKREGGLKLRGNSVDITSRVDYEKKIQFKEQEYRNLVNSIHEVIFKIDRYGNFTFLNEAWFRATKYSVLNTIGTSAISYLADDFKNVFTALNNEDHDPFSLINKDLELQIIDAQGVKKWFHAYIQIQFNEFGRLDYASGTFINIHQRKQAELAKRDSDIMFQSISENMSDVLTLVSTDFILRFCTPGVESLLGYKQEEIIGKSLLDFIHPEDQKVISDSVIQKMFELPNEKTVFQYRIKINDGSFLWLETVIQLIQIEQQSETMFMCVSRDINNRKAAEEEIKKALERERELNELKSKFVTMASHEFRTPLTSIHSSVEIMEMYAAEFNMGNSGHFTKHYSNINKQVKRLTNLMNGILIVGKTEADKMPFNPQYHNISSLCDETIELGFKNLEDNRNIDFRIEGNPQDAFVDANLFEHIITNALSNALKFSKGKPNPEMRLEYFDEGFEITVQDFGIGIPKNEQSNVFNSFYRAENTTNIEGTGLGMVVMKQFVEMHEGQMHLQSEENKGTQIKFEFRYELEEIQEKVKPILG